jgi:hypothetical protein
MQLAMMKSTDRNRVLVADFSAERPTFESYAGKSVTA